MIHGATVFVLFWLRLAGYIASLSKFVWKFYFSAAPRFKQTLEWVIPGKFPTGGMRGGRVGDILL